MNLNTILREAITKGALGVMRKPIVSLRHDVADLKRQVAELKRLVRDVQKNVGAAAKVPASGVETDKPVRIRPTGPMVRKLRQKLGLTQTEMSKLLDVSSLTVSKWETTDGRIMMRNRTLTTFAKVRALGKREAKKMLAGEQV